MKNLYLSKIETFEYQDGTRIKFELAIDQSKLSQMVWEASFNKNRKSTDGPLTISIVEQKHCIDKNKSY